jgi:hypothetical protein
MGKHDEALARFFAAAAEGDVDGVRAALAGLEPSQLDASGRTRVALVLVEVGEEAEARRLAADTPELAGLWEKGHAAEVAGDGLDEADGELAPGGRRAEPKSLAEPFLRWFGGRRDLYAKQWWSEARGRGGYHPVREPLTLAVAEAHLSGRITIGQYLLHSDGLVSVGVIDLDLAGAARARHEAVHGDAVPVGEHPVLLAYARRLMASAARFELPVFGEDSGGKGLHLWLFVEPRRPARMVRDVLRQVVEAAGPTPPEVGVELFPKQELAGPRGLSSLVKLPLGLHQRTLRPCPLLDDELKPIKDPHVALARLRPCDPGQLAAVAGRRVVALPAPEVGPGAGPPPALPSAPTPRTLAEALRAIEPGADERASCERMLAGCAGLRGIVERAFAERRLEPWEARAVTYSLGLVSPLPERARDVLVAAGSSLRELERVSRGLPSPVGCARLSRMTGCQGCSALRDVTPYPSPAALAVGSQAPGAPRHAPFAAWIEGAQPVETPLDAIGAALARIESRLARLEGEEPGPEGS